MDTNGQNTNEENGEKRKNDKAFNSKMAQYAAKIGIVLFVVALILGIVGLVKSFIEARDTQISPSELAVSLKPVGQLVILQVKATKVGVNVKMKTGPLCTFDSDYLINSTINAGIDLTTFSEANIIYDEKKDNYRITLPYPKLTNCTFTPQRYVDRQSMCLEIDRKIDLDNIANYVTETGIRDDVIKNGIFERAQRETTVLMQELIKSLTGKNAEIVFEKPENEPSFPPSCSFEKPAFWNQDRADVWVKNE